MPAWQYRHRPQLAMPSRATRSPARNVVTAVPTSATSPAISCPGHDCGTIISPWYQCRSEPQMPQLRTATTTSSGPGVVRGISSTTTVCGPRQSAPRIVAVTSPPRVVLLDDRAHPCGERVPVLESQPGSGDGSLDHDLDLPRYHVEPAALRHEAPGATTDHRHDGQAEANGQHEGALLELAEPAVAAARAFREDDERVALVAHAVQRGDGLRGALAVDRHHTERVENGTHHGVAPEALLGREADRPRQVAEEREDVEVALVVRRVDDGPDVAQVLESRHRHPHAEHPFQRPGPRLGEVPRQAAVARHAVEPDGDGAHADQHAPEEVR